jgi:hypothetical protein
MPKTAFLKIDNQFLYAYYTHKILFYTGTSNESYFTLAVKSCIKNNRLLPNFFANSVVLSTTAM